MEKLKSVGEQIDEFLATHTPPEKEIKEIAYQMWVGREKKISSPEQQERDWENAKVIWAVRQMKGVYK